MAQLAIKGHPTRGKEVIQLLEMLGGNNNYSRYCGYNTHANTHANTIYYIDFSDRMLIKMIENPNNISDFIIFTLEEFFEKFPYKVGDKVIDATQNKPIEIYKMHWSENNNCIYYDGKRQDNVGYRRSYKFLQPYKEETMEEKEDKPKAPILSNRYDYAEGKCGYVIPDGYEFDYIKEGFQTEIILKPKKPQYPKTYEGCYGVLGYEPDEDEISCYQGHLIESFVKLLICRDAYWKIAGEQMGLGKPWKPDWESETEQKYTIVTDANEICSGLTIQCNAILAFPTEEMRDAFYENFKDLIEQCKELL